MPDKIAQEQQFWGDPNLLEKPYIHFDEAEFRLILKLLGGDSVRGKNILEIGCGAGVWTANLSRLGARVYHLDLSPDIVLSANRLANSDRAIGLCADMNFLPFPDSAFDLVFGSMVLHHATDHTWLGKEICRVIEPGGNAVFHENSSRNPILMLARSTLVGRWGIPKHSSPGEHPLQPGEIAQVGEAFEAYHIYFARMVFLQMAVKYLFKRETGGLYRISRRVDRWIYRWLSFMRPLSYYQILDFEKSGQVSLE
ncbi:MAG: class I SAM-dependent methyltransferase [Anaerolineales bacterium]|nr:class I SAM-dependent methyltransferase [Anaerolineales bacterium]